ncbi:MAG: hypothetical protein ABSF34_04580 [Verrucomicrobiota bacterium]
MYKKIMKPAYRMFKRKDRPNYYIQNNSTREQYCLGTSDKIEAKRLLDAKNLGNQSAALNLQLGKTFIAHADPKMATRTWQGGIATADRSHGRFVLHRMNSQRISFRAASPLHATFTRCRTCVTLRPTFAHCPSYKWLPVCRH